MGGDNTKPVRYRLRNLGWLPAVLIVCGVVAATGGWLVMSNTLTWGGHVDPWQPTDEDGNPVPFIIEWRENSPPPYPPIKHPDGYVTEDLLTAEHLVSQTPYYVHINANLFNSGDFPGVEYQGPVRVMMSIDGVTTDTYGGWAAAQYSLPYREGHHVEWAWWQFDSTIDRSEEGVTKVHEVGYFTPTDVYYPAKDDHTWYVDYTDAVTTSWATDCWITFGSGGDYTIKVWVEGTDGSILSNQATFVAS